MASLYNGVLLLIEFWQPFVMKLTAVDGTFFFKLICLTFFVGVQSNEGETSKELFKIEGKVQAPDAWAKLNPDWKLHTYILIDGGEYRAFLKYIFLFDGKYSIYTC